MEKKEGTAAAAPVPFIEEDEDVIKDLVKKLEGKSFVNILQ